MCIRDRYMGTSDKAYLTEEAKRQAEARKEACERLDNLQQKVLKLRTFYNLKLFIKKEKYRGKIDLLRDTITRNAQSHGNLSLAERREFILKQELVHAQESMAGIERVLRKMQTTLKEKNETLMKFNQANNARAHKMIELEAKVKKYADADKSDILDAQKELEEKIKEMGELSVIESTNKGQVDAVKREYKKEMKLLQNKLNNLANEKAAAIKKVEELQGLIAKSKLSEVSRMESEGGMWHGKCKELLAFCKALKDENESLREVVKERSQIVVEESGARRRVGTAHRNAAGKIAGLNRSMCTTGSRNRMANTKGFTDAKKYSKNEMARRTADTKRLNSSNNNRPQTQDNFIICSNNRFNRTAIKAKRPTNATEYS
eukprot:TRINITY_DN16440_c0_g1_i1.p1 TRINITY_DN16440_c0_g1~~TRINITY_DN16440_c0_g1_i1.p1  ORF type:complete len:375 (+),score=125.78 TRINITY_DN16440_c0_g1_i1:114-1238(+)